MENQEFIPLRSPAVLIIEICPIMTDENILPITADWQVVGMFKLIGYLAPLCFQTCASMNVAMWL